MADTTVDPSTATGGGDNYITEDPEANANATGPKYLALHVPNFSGNLHSYLCLGADSTWREDSTTTGTPTSVYGDVLASLVQGFCDDDRVRGQASTPANALPPGESVDDQGVTPANLDENAAQSQTSMQAESAQLHSKGGWRDHSDGNRITTTYGDKVEVIRGNYKLLVLGRQDQVPFTTAPGQTVPSVSQWADSEVAGWDISGGLVSTDQGSLMYPPSAGAYNNGGGTGAQELLNTQYTWLQDSDGNWGWTMQTVTGTYGPQPNQGNGRVVSYTWVDERYSYVGSGNPTPAAASSSTVNPDGDPNLQTNRRPAKTLIDRQWGENIQTELNAKRATAPTSAVPGFAPGKPTLISTWASDGDTYINTSAAQWLYINNSATTKSVQNHFGSDALAWESILGYAENQAGGLLLGAVAGAVNQGWSDAVIGGLGKVGPTGAGIAEGQANLPTKAVAINTVIDGPSSEVTTTRGTKSVSDYVLGGYSETNLTLGGYGKTVVTCGFDSNLHISAGFSNSTIKVALGPSTNISLYTTGDEMTVCLYPSVTTDICTRTIIHLPSVSHFGVEHHDIGLNHSQLKSALSILSAVHTCTAFLHNFQ